MKADNKEVFDLDTWIVSKKRVGKVATMPFRKKKSSHVEDTFFALQVAWIKLLDTVMELSVIETKSILLCHLDEGWTKKGLKDLGRIKKAIVRFEKTIKNNSVPRNVKKTFAEVKELFAVIAQEAKLQGRKEFD